jgi:hypothetical protein
LKAIPGPILGVETLRLIDRIVIVIDGYRIDGRKKGRR